MNQNLPIAAHWPSPPPAALRIGEVAPNFTARSTAGPLQLADYRGQWLVLFSHPADFTPVCTSEFVAIARAADRFAELDCALVALSVDSLFSHYAWVRLIRDRLGVEVRFPVVEDPTLEIGRAYGMVSAEATDASAVRASYYIDPDGIVRATSCYPASVGRSVEEMLRTVAALQRTADGDRLAPADWRPGDALLRAPDHDLDAIFAAEDMLAWFYQPAGDDKGTAHG